MSELSAEEVLAIEEARRLSKSGNIAAAERIFQVVTESNSTNAEVHWIFGIEYMKHSIHSKALIFFRRATELDDLCVPAWSGLGHTLISLELWNEAEVALRRRLKLRESPSYCVFLATALARQAKYEEAIMYCERALSLDNDQVDALIVQGNVYSLMGDLNKSLQSCQRAIELAPDYDEAYICLGVVLVRADRFDEASVALQQAIDLNPENPTAYRQFGWLQNLRGDTELAASYIRSANELESRGE